MKYLSKQEMADWRHQETTTEVINRLETRIAEALELLAAAPGVDPINDARIGGVIRGYRDVLELTEGDDEDEMESSRLHHSD